MCSHLVSQSKSKKGKNNTKLNSTYLSPLTFGIMKVCNKDVLISQIISGSTK